MILQFNAEEKKKAAANETKSIHTQQIEAEKNKQTCEIVCSKLCDS